MIRSESSPERILLYCTTQLRSIKTLRKQNINAVKLLLYLCTICVYWPIVLRFRWRRRNQRTGHRLWNSSLLWLALLKKKNELNTRYRAHNNTMHTETNIYIHEYMVCYTWHTVNIGHHSIIKTTLKLKIKNTW